MALRVDQWSSILTHHSVMNHYMHKYTTIHMLLLPCKLAPAYMYMLLYSLFSNLLYNNMQFVLYERHSLNTSTFTCSIVYTNIPVFH